MEKELGTNLTGWLIAQRYGIPICNES